jgi:hypothetical protein
MRRGVASLIMGLSLLLASASWAGFVLSHTVLDPGRSERLADHLLDDPDVRAAIITRLADGLATQIPASIPVPRQSLELAATLALDDPRVEALVKDGIVRAHQNALNGVDEPITLDATALGQAAHDALVKQVPVLAPLLPAAPPIAVEVPGAGLAWLGTVKSVVDRYTLLGAVAALAGIVSAFILARNRPAALRRVAYWAFASAAFWLAVAYGLPAVVGAIAPSAMAIASAAVDVFAGAMIRPALVLAGLGVVLLVASFIWSALTRRRPAALLDGAAKGRGRSPAQGPPPVPRGGAAGFGPYGPRPAPGSGGSPRLRPETTQEYPIIVSGQPPIPAGQHHEADETAAWVEGQGYAEQRPTPAAPLRPYAAPPPDEAPTLSVPGFNEPTRDR